MEIYQLQTNHKKRIYRINFIQQQGRLIQIMKCIQIAHALHLGDAMALVAAVKLLDQTLQTYEHEAELVATANGWNTRNDIFM